MISITDFQDELMKIAVQELGDIQRHTEYGRGFLEKSGRYSVVQARHEAMEAGISYSRFGLCVQMIDIQQVFWKFRAAIWPEGPYSPDILDKKPSEIISEARIFMGITLADDEIVRDRFLENPEIVAKLDKGPVSE